MAQRASWYNASGMEGGAIAGGAGAGLRSPGTSSNGQFVGIDMSYANAGAGSGYPGSSSAGGASHAGYSGGQQHPGYYGSSMDASNTFQQHPQLQKRPSTQHMQASGYGAATAYHGNSAGAPGPGLAVGSPSASSSMAMQLSPALRSAPPSALQLDSSRMSYSPAGGNGASQLYHPASPSTSGSASGVQNPGLGVSRGVLPQSLSMPAGVPTLASLQPYNNQQQPHGAAQGQGQQQGRNPQRLNTSTSCSHPSHNFHRSSSSGSALSVSTSPTASNASPMTPSSPAYMQSSSITPSLPGNINLDASPALRSSNASSGTVSPGFRVPNPPSNANAQGQGQRQLMHHMHSNSTSTQGSSSEYDPQRRSSLAQSINQQQQQQQQQMNQYAPNNPYLEDPNFLNLDRRQGSYSPSHYALAGGQVFAQPGQMYSQPYVLQSPRQPGQMSHSSSYATPQQASTSASGLTQSQLSPVFPRQQQSTSQQMNSGMASPRFQQTHNMSSVPPSPSQYATVGAATPSKTPTTPMRRARSAGTAFRRVNTGNDLRPNQAVQPRGRRADADGGTVSPLKALTTQLSQTYHLVNPNFRYETSHNPRRVLTKPSKPAGNDGYDNEDSDYILYVNDVLGSEANKYLILDVLGQGTFGQVVKCQNMKTHEIVGVKVIKNKPAYYQQSMMEITILEMLNLTYDPQDKHHILRLKDTFVHCRHLCLVFELLSSNLYELIKQNAFRGLSTSLVRVFTEQLLDALCVLKDARLIHCDLKPENILLKTLQSPDIKVIDFGSACHERQTVYTYIQSRFYRSPEVLLGLPYSTSIDMWSLGCICVELFLGLPIFPGTSEFNQITRIVEMLGLPPTYMLETGKQVSHFFNVYYDEYGRKQWRLKSLEEYEREHPNAKEQPSKKFFAASTLPDIIKTYPNHKKGIKQADLDREMQIRLSFIDFVQGLLNMNPMERWTPQQAKMHPFILNEPLRAPFVPPGVGTAVPARGTNSSGQAKQNANDRPYGGLPPNSGRTTTRTYQDAAAYQQHLNQQQAHAAAMNANALRQQHVPTNPWAYMDDHPPKQPQMQGQPVQAQGSYSVPQIQLPPGPGAPRQSAHQHTPSQSMSYSVRNSASGPLSPLIPTNPPAVHHHASRGRSGTFSQLDVPPALQKAGIDLASYNAIGTPQLRREDQRAAWERRHAGDPNALDRRRSLRQANPHLEHLEYYAQSGQPGNYYQGTSGMPQAFSVVVDPRTQEHMHPAASAVTIPPQAYTGPVGTRMQAQPSAPAQMQVASFDAFDQYDVRDGLNSMLHQPLLPTQQHGNAPTMAYYSASASSAPSASSMYGVNLPYPGQASSLPNNELANGPSKSAGRQRKSDAQLWP